MKHRAKVKIPYRYIPANSTDVAATIKREQKRLAKITIEQDSKVRTLRKRA